MNRKLAAALVIARRDYIASVFSKTFLLFLIGPIIPVIFAFMFSAAEGDGGPMPAPVIKVIAEGPSADAIIAARARLADAVDGDIPQMYIEHPAHDQATQIRALLRDPAHPMVLSGLSRAPLLSGPAGIVERYQHVVGLMVNDAHRAAVLATLDIRLPPIPVALHAIRQAPTHDGGRKSTAHGAQLTLFLLTMILASMLLSNLVEEKSSKVIEVLAAAVPVDAIFFGKLVGMLGMSLTAIAAWFATGSIGILAFAPEVIASLSAPAIGWLPLVCIGIVYFITSYLLLGAVFLGVGAQASSVREVQTLSLPVTMVQLGVFGLASTVVNRPDGAIGIAAMIFPWSSPMAMIARGAMLPSLWPHLAAMIWQALWVALTIGVGARMFRRSVLRSGGPRRWFLSRKKPTVAA
jgi:ABC-2 type transport system permease protein